MADNKAFAKAVAPRKTFIFALQKSTKHLSLLLAVRQETVSMPPIANLENDMCKRMKLKTTILTFFLSTLGLIGQNFKVDTLHVIDFNGMLEMSIGQDTVCSLNGKRISTQKYLSIRQANCILWRYCDECKCDTTVHVFFVYEYDMKGQLLRSSYRIDPEHIYFGPYKEYYRNGKIKTEGQYVFFTDSWQPFYDSKNFYKKIGTWKYYQRNGKLRRTVKYN